MIGENIISDERNPCVQPLNLAFKYVQFVQIKLLNENIGDFSNSEHQIALIPICGRHLEYSEHLKKRLEDSLNARIKIFSPESSLNTRIKYADKSSIPFIVTIGDREVEEDSLAVRQKYEGNIVSNFSLSEFKDFFKKSPTKLMSVKQPSKR